MEYVCQVLCLEVSACEGQGRVNGAECTELAGPQVRGLTCVCNHDYMEFMLVIV